MLQCAAPRHRRLLACLCTWRWHNQSARLQLKPGAFRKTACAFPYTHRARLIKQHRVQLSCSLGHSVCRIGWQPSSSWRQQRILTAQALTSVQSVQIPMLFDFELFDMQPSIPYVHECTRAILCRVHVHARLPWQVDLPVSVIASAHFDKKVGAPCRVCTTRLLFLLAHFVESSLRLLLLW